MIKRIILLFTCILMGLNSCQRADGYIAISGYAQGGTYTIKINLNGPDGRVKVAPTQIKASIDSIFNVIDTTLSGYNKGSMISRFNRGETIVPNSMFKDIYQSAYHYWETTGGLLDVAAGKLYDLWGFGFTDDQMPSDEEVQKVLQNIGMKHLVKEIHVDSTGHLAPEDLLNKEGVDLPRLNYNAIAQGYSCDVIAQYLYSIGVKDMLVEVGEIYCDGVNPYGKDWSIGVDRPEDGNDQPGQFLQAIWQSDGKPHGIVTSGNYRKFYVKDGKKFSHTIHPLTGYPTQHNLLSATILAKDAMTADAYATYCMVLGLEEAKKFISNQADIEGYLIYAEGEEMKEWYSEGFKIKEAN